MGQWLEGNVEVGMDLLFLFRPTPSAYGSSRARHQIIIILDHLTVISSAMSLHSGTCVHLMTSSFFDVLLTY